MPLTDNFLNPNITWKNTSCLVSRLPYCNQKQNKLLHCYLNVDFFSEITPHHPAVKCY